MEFCTCKIRKLSNTYNTGNHIFCVVCNKPIKCEHEGCDKQATSIYVCYMVCDEHIEKAKDAYLTAKPKKEKAMDIVL